IVNVVGSAIAKEVDSVIYTNAGPEIAVATTKGYTTQLAVFYILAVAIALSKSLIENFDGKVPCTMKELTTLPGVGRKTASVVLAEAFNIPAFAVDTHVFRVANRLGIGDEKSPDACEAALKNFFPKENWAKTHLQMVIFGRYTCKAQNPKCTDCPFQSICKYFQKKG
ncbi:MAG: SIS domain-containing protein, partial [Clostridia bacterium]|nr:SIS domain-containing protein [Clostridia bacterium]